MNFFVIVPVLNAQRQLDKCLSTVLTQLGSFDLHVHVQDGRSNDDTLTIAHSWAKWVDDPLRRNGRRRLTWNSERDNGLYDAIGRAARLVEDPHYIMTWLGSDDALLPGTLATVASIFAQLPEVLWLTGAAFCSDETGENYSPYPVPHFTRYHLAEGHHDGRTLPFVMQEGTFWRFSLWQKVGGIDPRFDLAGDWDLWRRFAQHARLYTVTFPLGQFTRRCGQKSEDMCGYYREVDSALAGSDIGNADRDFSSFQLVRLPWDQKWEVHEQKLDPPLPPIEAEPPIEPEPLSADQKHPLARRAFDRWKWW